MWTGEYNIFGSKVFLTLDDTLTTVIGRRTWEEIIALPDEYRWDVDANEVHCYTDHVPLGISDHPLWSQDDLAAGCIDYAPTPMNRLDGASWYGYSGPNGQGHIIPGTETHAATNNNVSVDADGWEVKLCWPDGGMVNLVVSPDGTTHSYTAGDHDNIVKQHPTDPDISFPQSAWTRSDKRCYYFDTVECLPWQVETVNGNVHTMTFYRYLDPWGTYGDFYVSQHYINDLLPLTVAGRSWRMTAVDRAADRSRGT